MIPDPNKRYDVVYSRENAKNIVVQATTFRSGIPYELAAELADRIGEALFLKHNGDHYWLTMMPTDADEHVFITESADMN